MFKSYTGYYDTFSIPIKDRSLPAIKKQIKQAMGEEYKDYETAYIREYNIIGRESAQHYFSIKDKSWHRSKNTLTWYSSWDGAIEPLRSIAQWLLRVLGYKAAEEKRTAKWIQQRKIDELYGR